MRPLGLSLIEFLVVMAISGIIGLALMGFTRTVVQTQRAQNQITQLEQQAASLSQLLQTEVRQAGYRGGDISNLSNEFSGGGWSEAEQGQAVGWLANYWPAGRSTLSVNSDGTVLSLSRLREFARTAPSTGRVCLETITYTFSAADNSLRRASQTYTASVVFSAPGSPTWSATDCQGNAGGSSSAAVGEGVEDFQVFFQDNASNWTALRPASNSLRSVGIYLRMRSAAPLGPGDCAAYPRLDWTAQLQQSGVNAAAIGIPSSGVFSGTQCNYYRRERVLTLFLTPSLQVY